MVRCQRFLWQRVTLNVTDQVVTSPFAVDVSFLTNDPDFKNKHVDYCVTSGVPGPHIPLPSGSYQVYVALGSRLLNPPSSDCGSSVLTMGTVTAVFDSMPTKSRPRNC
jgi:hypothetical protein